MHRNKPVTLNFKELSIKICGTQKTVHFIIDLLAILVTPSSLGVRTRGEIQVHVTQT